jgi:biopolymer transport protein ExbD
MSGVVFRKPKARKYVELNVTSLVDVLFLLLIFFTLTSTFKRAGEIELQLPKSTTGQPVGSETSRQPVDLVLTEKGTLLLDGSPTTFEALLPRLRSRRARPGRAAAGRRAHGGIHGRGDRSAERSVGAGRAHALSMARPSRYQNGRR